MVEMRVRNWIMVTLMVAVGFIALKWGLRKIGQPDLAQMF